VAVGAVEKAHKGTKRQDNKDVSRGSSPCYSLPQRLRREVAPGRPCVTPSHPTSNGQG
jgi:hypothetical protein